MSSSSVEPYWGTIDANMDWCESNYAFTPYVAEFMNTISSIPIILYGVYGWWMSRRFALNESRFSTSFFGLAMVGIGSTLFHATLRRYAQCLDELPMLWTAAVLLYNSIDVGTGFPIYKSIKTNSSKFTILQPSSTTFFTHRRSLKLILLFSLIFMTAIYFYIPDLFLLFFLGYGFFVVSFTVLMARSIFYVDSKRFSAIPRKLFQWAFLGYFGGFLVWSIENVACQYLPTWAYFHCLWHLMAGLGTYFSIECQIAWRAEQNQAKSIIQSANVPIPYVKVEINTD